MRRWFSASEPARYTATVSTTRRPDAHRRTGAASARAVGGAGYVGFERADTVIALPLAHGRCPVTPFQRIISDAPNFAGAKRLPGRGAGLGQRGHRRCPSPLPESRSPIESL